MTFTIFQAEGIGDEIPATREVAQQAQRGDRHEGILREAGRRAENTTKIWHFAWLMNWDRAGAIVNQGDYGIKAELQDVLQMGDDER